MTDKLFDQFIKSKLKSYDSGAPMHVWEKMQKDRDDKKGFFFFNKKYFLLAAGLIIAIGTGFIVFSSSKDNKQKNRVHQKMNSLTQQKINNTPLGQPSESSSTSVSNKNTFIKTSENNIVKQNSGSEINTSVSADPIAENSLNFTIVKTSKNKSAIQQHTRRGSQQSTNSLKPSESVIEENQNKSTQQSSLKRVGAELSQKKKPLLQLGAIDLPMHRPSCPTINGPRRRDQYLEFYLSPDYNIRNLSSGTTPSAYLNERRNTENFRTSYSAGVRLVKNLGEKTLIKAGVNYSQINERLKLVSEKSKQLTQVITIRTVIRAPGDTLFVRDTMYYEQTGTRYRTTYNRYRFIDIPLLFSYEFGKPEIMQFAINAGPVFNIISMYRGEVLDTSYSPVKISTTAGSNVNNWRNNIGVGFFASMSIYKRLNDRIHLFGEPYVRYNFNPVTQSNNLVKQRYFNTGMQLGIRYNLLPKGQRYR
jgi:hypothetical protein